MNKFHALKQLSNNGDSIVNIRNADSILVTTDFSTKYIKNKKYGRFTILKNCILVFSWTDDKFRNIELNSIFSILPLSSVLNNKSPEIIVENE